jgi:5'-nucleotidase (lipoprotein e(P4) family)
MQCTDQNLTFEGTRVKSIIMKKILVAILFVPAISLYAQPKDNGKALPVLWQQAAAEYRALCYQAFNIAALRLNAAVREKKKGRPLAIITDLDETILDNSYSEAQLIRDGKTYSSQGWKDWTGRSAATEVPGAAAFLQSAHKKGVTVFYVSNRDTSELVSTLLNLQKLGLPDTNLKHMLFLQNTSSKEERRKTIMSRYNVIMLLGDNLNDFMNVFEKKNIEERFTETDKMKEEWGRKFIVLPNYGRNLSKQQKDSILLRSLKGYQ